MILHLPNNSFITLLFRLVSRNSSGKGKEEYIFMFGKNQITKSKAKAVK